MKTEHLKIIEDVKNWHAETFPDADLNTQLIKLEEEFAELRDELQQSEKLCEELADVIIVCAGLLRWNSATGDMLLMNLISRSTFFDKAMEKVEKKMEINKARKWQKMPDGTYHH